MMSSRFAVFLSFSLRCTVVVQRTLLTRGTTVLIEHGCFRAIVIFLRYCTTLFEAYRLSSFILVLIFVVTAKNGLEDIITRSLGCEHIITCQLYCVPDTIQYIKTTVIVT